MLPVAPLMIEHRLIERMVRLLQSHADRLRSGGGLDTHSIDGAVDFIRTYADRCHHGKEEDILFRDLASRELSAEHRRVMEKLVDEHTRARGLVGRLVHAKPGAAAGDEAALAEVLEVMEALRELYPKHIEKEDRRFFVPVMQYFSEEERSAMLAEMLEFDRRFVYEHYRRVVEEQEHSSG